MEEKVFKEGKFDGVTLKNEAENLANTFLKNGGCALIIGCCENGLPFGFFSGNGDLMCESVKVACNNNKILKEILVAGIGRSAEEWLVEDGKRAGKKKRNA